MLQAKSYGPWLWDLHSHNENASLLASLGFMNCNKWRSFSIGITDICYKCSADNFTPITLWSYLLTLKVSVCKYHWSVSSKNWNRWRLQTGAYLCCKWVPHLCENHINGRSKTTFLRQISLNVRQNLFVLMKNMQILGKKTQILEFFSTLL